MPRIQRLVLAAALCSVYLYSRPVSAQTKHTDTSTAGIQFPENTGRLPRAKMPEGSAEQPVVNPNDYDPPLDENLEHTHPHEHGGKVHTHKHSHANGPSHDHLHPEGVEGEEGGEQHPEEHQPPAQQPPPQDQESKFKFTFDGYLKVIAEVIENDPLSTFIGRNDGFRVGNARIGINAAYGPELAAYISLEASVPKTEDFNQPNAELTVGPRDLFIAYQLSRHAQITLGRFKAPYDISELESEGHRVFIDQPVESKGVAPTQGFEVMGLRQGREIGVMLHRTRLGLSDGGFDVGYALALTNGRTDFALNDNDRPAGFARFSLFYGPYVNLNIGGFTDTRTTGDLPNLFEEEVKGVEGSLVVVLGDLRIEGQILFQRTTFPTAGTPRVDAFGFHGQWSYRIWGLEAAYRFSYYDPNDRFDIDAVNEHTLGLSYYLTDLPLRFTINATLAQEQRGRELENNRLALLAQYNF